MFRRDHDSSRRRATGRRTALVLVWGLALFAGSRAALPQPAWVDLGLFGRAQVERLVYDPLLPNVAYAAIGGGGIFRSEDGGRFWRPASQGLPDGISVFVLALSPQGHLFAVGNWGRGPEVVSLFESGDGARSWQPVNLPPYIANLCHGLCDQPPSASLAFDAQDPDTFYLAAGPGGLGKLFRTRDHGASWEGLAATLAQDALSIAVDPLSPRHLYLGVHHGRQGDGLYVSSNEGATWARAVRGRTVAIAISPADPAVVWAARPGSIVASRDRGVHWSTVLDTGTYRFGGHPTTPLLADAADAETAYVGNRVTQTASELLKTTDGGRHWQVLTQGLPPSMTVLAIAQSPLDPSRLLLGNANPAGGVLASQDGGASWSIGGYGLFDAKVSALAATPDGILFASASNSLYQAAAGSSTWQAVLQGPFLPTAGALTIDPTDPRTVYSGVIDSTFFGLSVLDKSTDGGATWDELDVPAAVAAVNDLVVDPNDPRILYAAVLTYPASPTGILKSQDAGATWTLLPAPVGAGELALDPSTSPSTVYVANGSLQKSSDGGATWTTLAVTVGGREIHALNHLAIAPNAPRLLYALSEDHGATVVRSTDGGATWAPYSQRRNRSAAPPADSHHPLAVDPADSRVLFAGWNAGVTRSVDGAAWTELGVGLPPSPVQTLVLDRGRVLVGTASAGAFGLALGGLGPRPSAAP